MKNMLCGWRSFWLVIHLRMRMCKPSELRHRTHVINVVVWIILPPLPPEKAVAKRKKRTHSVQHRHGESKVQNVLKRNQCMGFVSTLGVSVHICILLLTPSRTTKWCAWHCVPNVRSNAKLYTHFNIYNMARHAPNTIESTLDAVDFHA